MTIFVAPVLGKRSGSDLSRDLTSTRCAMNIPSLQDILIERLGPDLNEADV